ncbi:Crp/Fnr family transcriptional regulator [Maridesulfovibrio sp.]|uniref:Crp/Fnr family transcriptional regulator n=1 Tax=Maridesulfovibrio sp. TaxID=2795000 RepID=UPI0039EFEE79
MFWHKLPHSDLFESLGEQLIFDKNASLPIGKNVYYLEEGLAALTMLTASGAEKVFMYFKEGNFFGYMRYVMPDERFAESYIPINLNSMVAKTLLRVRAINHEEFFNVIESDPQLYKDFSISLTQNLSNVLEHSYWIASEDASTRLCLMLINFMEKKQEGHFMPRCFTYLEMGNFLSIHTVTIAKIVKSLVSMGVLERHGHSIKIIDLERLRQLAHKEISLAY